MMKALILLSLLVVSACASTATREEKFVLELVSRGTPAAAFRVTGEEILISQRTVEAVRAEIHRTGDLMALATLPQGVHPYMFVAFVRRAERVDLLMTSVYWGKIQGKWKVSIDLATAESFVELATETFDCKSGPVAEHLFGSALIYWTDGDQVTCEGGWGTEVGAAFGERVQPIVDRATATYDPLR